MVFLENECGNVGSMLKSNLLVGTSSNIPILYN